MLEPLSPLGDGQVTGRVKPSAPQGSQSYSEVAGVSDVYEVPAAPPPEVLDALDRAARVLGELDRKNVSLGLRHDADSGRVSLLVSHGDEPGVRELSGA